MKRDQSAKTGNSTRGKKEKGDGGNYRPPAVSESIVFSYNDNKFSSVK